MIEFFVYKPYYYRIGFDERKTFEMANGRKNNYDYRLNVSLKTFPFCLLNYDTKLHLGIYSVILLFPFYLCIAAVIFANEIEKSKCSLIYTN